MKLYIYTLSEKLYEGDAKVVSLPTKDGEISVLDNHIPLVTVLKKGVIKVKNNSSVQDFQIESGFADVRKDGVILLVR